MSNNFMYAIPIIEEVQMFDYIQKNDVRNNLLPRKGLGLFWNPNFWKETFFQQCSGQIQIQILRSTVPGTIYQHWT